jgi:hypothetical protein
MDEWMNGWMGGWVGGWMSGYMNTCVIGEINGYVRMNEKD